MDFEPVTRFFAALRPEDMRWFLPVATGVLIAAVALLAAIFRGFTLTNVLALALGCALAASSVIGRLAFGREDIVTAASAVARSVAQSEANARAIAELRNAVVGLEQAVTDLVEARPAGGGAAGESAERLRKAQAQIRDALGAVDRLQREAAEQRRQAEDALRRLDAFLAVAR